MQSEGVGTLRSDAGDAPTDITAGARVDTRAPWARVGPRGRAVVIFGELVLVLVLWQVAVDGLKLVNPIFLPSPVTIMHGTVELFGSGELWSNVMYSLVSLAIGFALAIVVGVLLGLALGAVVPVQRLAGPILWSLYATPFLAYRPLSIVWFGFGQPPIIFLVFIASLFPILFNVAAGVREVEPSLISASRVFGSSTLGRYRDVVLPSILPYTLSGIRQAVNLAFIGLLVAEMTGSPNGLGALIVRKFSTFRTDQAFAVILLTIALILVATYLVDVITRFVAPWHAAEQEER